MIWMQQGSPVQRLTGADSPAAAGHPRFGQQETRAHAKGQGQAAAVTGREAAGMPRQADELAPEQAEPMSPGRRRRLDKQQAAAARERKQLESFHYDP